MDTFDEEEKSTMRKICYYVVQNNKSLVPTLAMAVEKWGGSSSNTHIKAGVLLDLLRRHGAKCLATVKGEAVSCRMSHLHDDSVHDIIGYSLNSDGFASMIVTHAVAISDPPSKIRTYFRRRPKHDYPEDWKERVKKAVEDYEQLQKVACRTNVTL